MTYLIQDWSDLNVADEERQRRRSKMLGWLANYPAEEWVKYSPQTLVDILSNLYDPEEDRWLNHALESINDATDQAMYKSLIKGILPPRSRSTESISAVEFENKALHLQSAISLSRGHPLTYMKQIDFYFSQNRLDKAREVFDKYNECVRPNEANYAGDSLHRKIERLFLPLLVKLYALDDAPLDDDCPAQPYIPDEFLFSPNLRPDDWQQQLQTLRIHKAKISGIDVRSFTSVTLVRLDDIYPEEVDRFVNKDPAQLIVIYGQCERYKHLPFSTGITVIGSGAQVSVGSISKALLSVPPATITANKEKMFFCHDTWAIGSVKGDINTNASLFNAGAYPLVYLNKSRLVGVTLNCNGCTQGVVGSGGDLCVANVNIYQAACTGIFLHDYEQVAVKDIILCGKKSSSYGSNERKELGITLVGSKNYRQCNNQKQVDFGDSPNTLLQFDIDWREK